MIDMACVEVSLVWAVCAGVWTLTLGECRSSQVMSSAAPLAPIERERLPQYPGYFMSLGPVPTAPERPPGWVPPERTARPRVARGGAAARLQARFNKDRFNTRGGNGRGAKAWGTSGHFPSPVGPRQAFRGGSNANA